MDDLFASLNPELAHKVAERDREGEPTRIFTTSLIEFVRYADLILILDRKGAVLLTPQRIREGNERERCVEWLGDELVEKLVLTVDAKPLQIEEKENSTLIQRGRRYTFHRQPALPLAETYDSGEKKRIKRSHLLINVLALFPKWVVFLLLLFITGAVFDETESGFVTGYEVYKGNPSDDELLVPAVEAHKKRFGKSPNAVATDRGFSSKKNESALTELGVKLATKRKKEPSENRI